MKFGKRDKVKKDSNEEVKCKYCGQAMVTEILPTEQKGVYLKTVPYGRYVHSTYYQMHVGYYHSKCVDGLRKDIIQNVSEPNYYAQKCYYAKGSYVDDGVVMNQYYDYRLPSIIMYFMNGGVKFTESEIMSIKMVMIHHLSNDKAALPVIAAASDVYTFKQLSDWLAPIPSYLNDTWLVDTGVCYNDIVDQWILKFKDPTEPTG